jgi:hypothetical protein
MRNVISEQQANQERCGFGCGLTEGRFHDRCNCTWYITSCNPINRHGRLILWGKPAQLAMGRLGGDWQAHRRRRRRRSHLSHLNPRITNGRGNCVEGEERISISARNTKHTLCVDISHLLQRVSLVVAEMSLRIHSRRMRG